MKSFTVLHILLLFVFLLVYQCSKAQDYVVPLRGDTIRGELKALVFGNEQKVQVNVNGKRQLFSAVQVKGYNYKGDLYEPVRTDKGYVFMKVIQRGYLTLYGYRIENQVAYDGMFLQKRDGTGMEVPNLGFKKLVARFLNDCPDVSAKIESGDFGKRQLSEIVTAYNSCIQARTDERGLGVAATRSTPTDEGKLTAWNSLEEKVRSANFAGKSDALDMITEIKTKVTRQERVPKFLSEGLKNSLAGSGLETEGETAIKALPD